MRQAGCGVRRGGAGRGEACKKGEVRGGVQGGVRRGAEVLLLDGPQLRTSIKDGNDDGTGCGP